MRQRGLGGCATLALMLMLVGVAAAVAQDAGAWTTVAGGPGTGCATQGSPYEFHVRRSDPRRVVVFFQGGGACWNAATCGGAGGRPTFDAVVDEADRPWATKATGIFDLGDSRNPVRDYTMVFAPYCTADVHLGVRTGRFEPADGQHVDVRFGGLANAQRVLDWVTAQYPEVRTLFVVGSSAGAVPSPVFASQLARRHPRARVIQVGEGAGAYRTARMTALLVEWGAITALKHDPQFSALDASTANFEDLYTTAAATPNLRLARIDQAEDAIQLRFLRLIGHEVPTLAPLLSGNVRQIRRAAPSFRSYTPPGAAHTVLHRAEFYSTTVGGVALTRWIDDLLAGREVRNVGDESLPAAVDRLP